MPYLPALKWKREKFLFFIINGTGGPRGTKPPSGTLLWQPAAEVVIDRVLSNACSVQEPILFEAVLDLSRVSVQAACQVMLGDQHSLSQPR